MSPEGSGKLREAAVRRGRVAAVLSGAARRGDAVSASVGESVLRLRYRSGEAKIGLGDLDRVTVGGGMLWAEVTFVAGARSVRMSGLSRRRARALAGSTQRARVLCWRRFLEAGGEVLGDLHARLAGLADRSRYFPEEDIAELAREARAAVDGFGGSAPAGVAQGARIGMLAGIRAFLKDPEAAGERANEAFVERELESSARYFDTVEKRPLTEEQRRAVVVNDRRNLVVASAGSGKTSVIVAKAGWLLSRGFNSPRELLLLAFARDARHEMAGRIGERLGADAEGLTVATFHSLGMSIIREVEGKWPSVAKSAHDSRALLELLTGIVRELFTDAELSGAVIGWFQGLFGPYRSQHECASWGEYWAYIRRYDIRSLKGERMKSYEECEIANFLYLNGVAYAYGGLYEEQVRKPDGRLYRPAFRLVESGVYIEHFALDEAGEPAGFVDRDAYLHEVRWKRGIHESHGTVLVESWSRDAAEGRLLDVVRERLAGCGVSLSQVSPAEIFAALEEDDRIEGFVGLVATFLHHFKGRRRVLEEVLAEAEALDDRGRAAALVRLFRAIHERYERELGREGEIDFHDMIDRAADYVESGRYASRFRYILVDEFQDISPGRARLLNALLDQPPGAQLFAVGDDWQAIFRFGGSDIALMREFEVGFGRASVLKLETTFRCSARIARVATQFVLKNPAQIEKTVRSGREGGGPGVFVWLRGKKNENLLDEALKRIAEDAGRGERAAEVLVLSRYRRLRPKKLDALAGRHDGLSISFKTVHASKGLEADYVIVLGLCTGRHAFPAGIADDPVLALVLAEQERFANAEERRLLYVAITRARRQVFLLVDRGAPSSFAQELMGGGYDVAVIGGDEMGTATCPACREGRLQRRENRERGGMFFGCSNWPYCEYAQPACAACGNGLMVREERAVRCAGCGATRAPCPLCDGWLEHKKGRFGPFIGCTNWPRCEHTAR
ncbi:MAG: UvrD-helicase domain-containing protein [Defluviicoccus sp.]|nr:UvrD-helicase domain-containing protein [Defluviicoccus sp.]MDE0274579.1 UvrD-helicase domain-containing protein [Defluviicoccus sp.]